MAYCFFRVNAFLILIILFTASLGISEQYDNQGVLTNSKIKAKSFKKIFQDIKKLLPGDLKKCQVEVIDIKLLKYDEADGDVGENWTVKVCQDTKEYLVTTFRAKGHNCIVVPKEKQFAKEKEIWDGSKKLGYEEKWRDALFYVDEIEAMDPEGKKQE